MSDPGIDELRALREYDAQAPPLDNATRNRARARLFAAMSTTSATGRSAARTGRRPVLRA
ncbi:Tat pathway signal protein, partial [Streptomyces sp. SID11233]|nr:Tat pathway signal protein [Streptomyces sp. SID11233]